MISAASCTLLATAHAAPWTVALLCATLGVGVGLSFAAMANAVVAHVTPGETGVATGINTIVRMVGGAFGGQVCATLLAANLDLGADAAVGGFLLSALALGAAAIAAYAGPRPAT